MTPHPFVFTPILLAALGLFCHSCYERLRLVVAGTAENRFDRPAERLKAVLTGMTHPGMWRSEAVPLGVGDLLSSMIRMPEIADGGSYTELNLAVASGEYVNLSMKFGYHFNMLDCYMSGNPRDNHIHFRFSGGATDMAKRSRRMSPAAA